jgi:hypothetical protein
MHTLCPVTLVAFFVVSSFISFVVGVWSFGSSLFREICMSLWPGPSCIWVFFRIHLVACSRQLGGFSHTRMQFLSRVALIFSGFDVCPNGRGDSYHSDLVHIVSKASLFRV